MADKCAILKSKAIRNTFIRLMAWLGSTFIYFM